jgi:hypothetical protein
MTSRSVIPSSALVVSSSTRSEARRYRARDAEALARAAGQAYAALADDPR